MAAKSRNTNLQIRRIFAIIRILIKRRNPSSLSEIADNLEEYDIPSPSTRTLERDIKEIESLGYKISLGKGKGYLLQNREDIAGKHFTDDEVQALQMSRAVFKYFDGTHIKSAVDEAINMITGAKRGDLTRDYLEELEDNFMVHLGPHRDLTDRGDMVDEIISAINGRVQLKISYQKPNVAEDSGIIEPYRLILYKDTLYLLAKKITESQKKDRALQIYHVSRINSADQIDKNFNRSEKLIEEFEEKLSHTFGILAFGDLTDVTLTFSNVVSHAIKERVWHNSQEITEHNDFVELKLKVLDSGEFIAWLLSWGKSLIKVEPESLAKKVVEARGC